MPPRRMPWYRPPGASAPDSCCGVGNPLGLGAPGPGQTVPDLGCGAGLDRLLAARRVGPSGQVVGVDTAPEMVEKARRNAQALGLTNVGVVHGEIGNLPPGDGTVDPCAAQRGLRPLPGRAGGAGRGVPGSHEILALPPP
jgi:arsenite methyltransferase